MRLIRQEKRVDYYEMTLRRRRRGARPRHRNARGIFDAQGHLVEIHGHILDITDRRALEEQASPVAEDGGGGTFWPGGWAHDFNNLPHRHPPGMWTDAGDVSPSSLHGQRPGTGAGGGPSGGDPHQPAPGLQSATGLRPRLIDLNQVVTGVEGMLRRLIGRGM